VRLGIDLDGVVADFNTGWTTRYNRKHGTALSAEMITEWGAMIPLTGFASMDEFWEWARNDEGRGLFHDLPPYAGALDALGRLAVDHEIIVITTKPHWAYAETFSWLADHAVPASEVHITEQKWWVDCDVYLDDGPHNLEALQRERPDRTICRFVRPWNRSLPGVIDVPDWDAFVALVDRQWC
jgi:uncharacterized HAD superfamily protein